jgi:hypothetical protein
MRFGQCCIAALPFALHPKPPHIDRVRQGGTSFAAEAARMKEPHMNLSGLVHRTRSRIEKRRRYNQLVAEINSLTERDLADINGNRSEMLHSAYREIYG